MTAIQEYKGNTELQVPKLKYLGWGGDEQSQNTRVIQGSRYPGLNI